MEEQKVTTEKPKNPGRVEWGRKLGKLAKQKKIKTEPVNTVVYNNYYTYGGAAVGIALIVIDVYKYSFNKAKPQATTLKMESPKERTFSDF